MRCLNCNSYAAVRETLLGGYVRISCDTCGLQFQSIEPAPLRVAGPPPPAEPFRRGIEISDRVAERKWTDRERAQVDGAIERVAKARELFTADAVWALLGPDFPVTKGIAACLMAARRTGLIEPTDKVVFSARDGVHGHGQRLTVWRSKVYRGTGWG